MGPMGKELQHLTPAQRDRLVASALALPVDSQALELNGLISGLAHLTLEQQDAIVTAGLNAPPRHLAIKYRLADEMEHLAPVQRRRVVRHLDDLPATVDKGPYITGLAKHMSWLEPAERRWLVDTALGQGRRLKFVHRGAMLGTIGAQASHLDPRRRSAIARAAMTDPSLSARSEAIAGLMRGAAALTEAERERLVEAALALPADWRRCRALTAFAAHVGNFSPPRLSRLFDGLADLNQYHHAEVIEALAGSGSHWSDDERMRLLTLARNLEGPDIRCLALASLGALEEALSLFRNRLLPPAGTAMSLFAERAVLQLCHGAQILQDADRQQLIGIVDQLDWYLLAELVGVLSVRLHHLSEAQQHLVKDKVLGLPDGPFKARLLATLARGVNGMGRPQNGPA
jgi:hypothetical protein